MPEGQRRHKLALILSLPFQINQTGLIILSLIKAHFHAEPIWSLNNGFKPKIETFFAEPVQDKERLYKFFTRE